MLEQEVWRVNGLDVTDRAGSLCGLSHAIPLIATVRGNSIDILFSGRAIRVAEDRRWRATTTTSPALNIPPDHPAGTMQDNVLSV